MKAFRVHTGIVAPLVRPNVDTDQIIPKQFLKRIERTGFGPFLFFDWRFDEAGNPKSDFVLNQSGYKGASILVGGKNFGCGSSREHAPWAIEDFGFRVVIAPTFADIFHNNCRNSGVLAIVTSQENVDAIAARAEKNPGYQLTVDLEKGTISGADGLSIDFEVDGFTRRCFLEGLDDIGLTLRHADAIADYEKAHA
ncbi:3-isopropylmalate dehydratase, small subunit [Candidatus Koribacter versatilis Ellin345]|uniref:3-isopropylmalate dehydratase small subunit n=1 Tax=Koribacter versatilis (strain Ellin345) TaxID=204669 RepID=LEUD_KORVE|nr:3-isopropylmalate dehydratase small subunit [Candidatus Koribacter versatilis]Q1IMI4.1 RecName: Full=3-isopropylmalate dehydratase small subunit; AltName: Full=Alpha-IPM isomerase; Short=IPMI; AltName: Full=Isopropylmalate isomerase [Candidatus Koribacter versatilis Ellin345]ABF41916.1 3-isopropylmalate dehydratase, small subunit [Candidatus Koribacter versatilis Ellin345]